MPDKNNKFIFHRSGLLERRAVLRLLFFALLWFLLTGPNLKSWIIGGPTVLLAVAASLLLSPDSRTPISIIGLCLFIPFFLGKSLQSGIDVMRRTLAARPQVNPGLVSYTTTLPEGSARILFANTISLLPGTLSADLKDDQVIVHAIDQDLSVWASLQQLEQRIALIFTPKPYEEKIR